MMIQAVLGNPRHPEYGVATIPFPIPHDQYAHCMELLEALEIGDAVKADCQVQEINSFYSVLKRTEMLTVNVEELNYLAKRLDSFDTGEAAQFQAMAHKLELFELKDLINLTFCCQQATVITDFSDLSAVGRDHYMNLHGGSAKTEELDALDGEETARRLIESGNGTITPYGVVYDNGMKLEQVYDGRFFPCYYRSPLGGILLAADEAGLTGLWFDGEKYFADNLPARHTVGETPILAETKRWLDIYFTGREPGFLPPLHPIGSAFRQSVWELLLRIPYGQTTTYGEIARQLAAERGLARISTQAVGGAVGHNEISILIPCHRVVGMSGSLTGYAGGISKKAKLLELERADMSALFIPRKGTAL